MASYRHDAQGFLIGEAIETNQDILRSQNQGLVVWKDIRADVKAIARSIGLQVANSARTNRPNAPLVNTAMPRAPAARTLGGNFVGSRPSAAQPVGRTSASRPAGSAASRSYTSVAVTQPRGANGRFVAGTAKPATPLGRSTDGRWVAGQQRPAAPGAGAAPNSISGGAAKTIADSISKLSASLSGADNIDPTVNAMKEVKDAVSPLGRGLFSLFGRSAERKKERWYGRFLKALTTKKPGETTVVRAGGGGGVLGGIGAAAGGMLGGAGGMLGSVLGKGKGLLKGGGKLLKRIPLLGGLISGGLALGSAFGMDDDPSKTPEENRTQRYKGAGGAAGMGIGGVIGGVLGSALGPIGTVVGGYLGSMAGEMIGEKAGLWAKDMIDADIGGKIVSAWGTTTAYISGAWDSVVTDAKAAWGSITSTASSLAKGANDWLKEKTGVDVKATASGAWDATKSWVDQKAGQATDFLKENAGALVPNAVKRAAAAGAEAATQAKAGYDVMRGNGTDAPAAASGLQSGARAAGGAAGSAANWVLGKTSERYESGGKGAGTVSTGVGDRGGASYGTYQLASKTGTLDKFLQSSGYGAQFAGLTPGSAEFNAKWKDVAKNDQAFGGAQHKFIEDTHFNPQMDKLQKAGVDLSGRGAAVKDAVWSTSVQFGGQSSLIQKALAGKDASKMSDAELVSAIQDYKTANNGSLFKNSSADVRAGTLARAGSEKNSLLQLAGAPAAASGNAVASVSNLPALPAMVMPSSVPARIPAMPEIKEAATQLNSGSASERSAPPIIFPERAGQDVADRRIAQIVSGGIA